MIDPVDTALLAVIGAMGGLIFGITGFGSALITIPLASHLVPLKFALALFAVADLASAFRIGMENPKNAVRTEWIRLVPMIVLGTALGVTALVNLPRAAGMLLLGGFVITYALYSLLARSGLRTVSTAWAWVAGFAGGVTSTLFGAGGPPYAIYLSHRGLTKEKFRATMAFATMTSISLRVVAFTLTGLLLDAAVWLTALFVVPATLLGIAVGRRMFLQSSRELLLRLIAVLLIGSGGSLIFRALG